MAIDPVIIRFALGGVQDVTRAFSTIEERMVRAESAGIESAKRGSAARVAGTKKEVESREKEYQRLVTDLDREEREATRATEREAQRREGIVRRSSEMAGRYAAQQANEEIREAKRTTQALERENEKRAASHRATAQQIGTSVAKGLRGVGAVATHALTLGGGFLLADVGREELRSGTVAQQIVNLATVGNGGKTPAGATTGNLSGLASQIAGETGMSKLDVLGGGLKYAQNARNADYAGVTGNMRFFAKLSKVSGTDINDIAESAGVLKSQNAGLDSDSMQAMLRKAYAMSGAGTMSFSDAAKQLGTMGSTRSYFSQDEGKSQISLMAAGQIARSGGDTGEAGTFVKDIASEVGIANRKWRKTHGGKDLIKTDDHGRMGSFEGMVADVYRGTKGNITEIGDMFGKRGSTFFRESEKSYITGEKSGGVEGGVQAVLANLNQVAGANMSGGDLDKMFDDTMKQPAEKLAAAFEKLKGAVAEELSPWIERFADKLPGLVEAVEPVVSALVAFGVQIADNPVHAALALFAMKMGGSAGMIADALIAGIALIDWAAAADRAMQRKSVANDVEGLNAASALRAGQEAGTLTPQNIADAQAKLAVLRDQSKPDELSIFDPRNGIAAANGGKLPEWASTPEEKALAKAHQTAAQSADLLDAALRRATESMGALASIKDPARWTSMMDRP